MRSVVNATPRPLYPGQRDSVPIVQEAGWAPEPVWTGAAYLAPTGLRSPDRPGCSELLYRLCYPCPPFTHNNNNNNNNNNRKGNLLRKIWNLADPQPMFSLETKLCSSLWLYTDRLLLMVAGMSHSLQEPISCVVWRRAICFFPKFYN